MSTANIKSGANVTPVSTPPPAGAQPPEHALRSVIAKRGTRIEELEIENATLQAQLEDALSSREHGEQFQAEHNSPVATHSEPDAGLAALKLQYQHLEARHAKLQEEFEKGKRVVDQAMKKYEAARESSRQWKAYVTMKLSRGNEGQDVEGQNVTPRDAPPMPREVSDIDITPRPLQKQLPEILEGDTLSRLADVTTTAPSNHMAPSSDQNQARNSPSSSKQSERITSSQTTVDDQPETGSTQIKPEHGSDDEPIVLRETNLKRRRGGSASVVPPPRIKQEPKSPKRPGSADEPIELRSEDWSSPSTRARPLLRMETSDLDAMRGIFQTPRKRKARGESRARSEERSRATLQPPTTLARNSSSLSDTDIPELPDVPIAFERSGSTAGANKVTPSGDQITPKARSHGRQRGALAQLSPNVPTMQQTAKKRRRVSEEDANKVGMLAEDGDESTSQVTPKAETTPTKKPDLSSRLDALLETNTPGRQPLKARRPASDTTRRTRPQRPQPQPEPAPTSTSKPAPPKSKYRRPPGIEKSPPPINPASEPLRLKPLEHQIPQNFRINPAFAGSEYAYHDPMNRKTKTARRCLPGCINPSCCGEFLDAARHGLLPPSSKSDDQILDDVFGPAILAAYPASERGELLIQARAQEFANAHGRHRTTFERAPTPPGFWRTEMPSTQEEMEDRRKADEMERSKAEGMWREAMRGGGRWIFRDE